MKNLFDVALRPLEKQGVDFWWLDWQQWLEDRKIKGLQNTWWLNYTFFTDMERNSTKRPMLYHRWGGLGNHRYQIGFSGDALISWKSLEYQPYFTNTASNVLYGYWSHDIGGHTFGGVKKEFDPELYTRWMQYGALSPIFRTHSAKNAALNKEIWNFRGDYFNAQYDAIKLRYALTPYMYTMARETYDSGISLCRPMYYDYPAKQEAYDFDRQYMFGDDILVAPIGSPAVNGFSKIKVWLPQGNDWYEWHTGILLKGGQVVEREFSLDEYPIYVKAGAIIPMYGDVVRNLEENPDKIKVGIFPGGNGQGKMYEDNGNDKDYANCYAYTTFKTETLNDQSLKVTIFPATGSFPGMKSKRNYEVTLYGSQMAVTITVNGKKINYDLTGDTSGSWNYNGRELSVNINIPNVPANGKVEMKIDFGKNRMTNVNDGLREKFKRLSKATTELKYKEAAIVLPEVIGKTEEMNRRLEYSPEKFSELIQEFNNNYSNIRESVNSLKLNKETESWYLSYLGL
jgi:alpha-glucosidase (family GH31 glycosyl hydrolase)